VTDVTGLGFYATAAQVIPTLMIVVAFQTRGWAGSGFFGFFALTQFLVCFFAVLHSLTVLYSEKPNALGPTIEIAAVCLLLITIGAALFPAYLGNEPNPGPRRRG
jgi:hypothetical protein